MAAAPPVFLIVAAVSATVAVVVIVLVLFRAIRREQRGFDVKPDAEPSDTGAEKP